MARTLAEYRALLETVEGGTVPAALALEIVAAGEAAEKRAGERTLAGAMEKSRRSRSYFVRRLPLWSQQGLARKERGTWLIRESVIPEPAVPSGGFDPGLDADVIAARILRRVG